MPSLRLPERIVRAKRQQRSRSCPAHRAWVLRHHCCVPGCERQPIECAHVRQSGDGGIGLKPSDCWTISLCAHHHQEQHRIGERAFETRHNLDLVALAQAFSRRSPHWKTLAQM
jgi:hypothetical protein